MHYLYLHGFASGPDSTKGLYFADAFARRGIHMHRLDLNVAGFTGLTVSGQVEVVIHAIDQIDEIDQTNAMRAIPVDRNDGPAQPAGSNQSAKDTTAHGGITLIGSSLGGYVSLLAAQRDSRISRLVLLAPAIGFDGLIRRRVGIHGMSQWKKEGTMPIEHYQWERTLPVHYGLYVDAARQGRIALDRKLPVLIFHGIRDESVPWKKSFAVVEGNPHATLTLLPSDHSLNDCLPLIENQAFAWMNLPPA